MNLNTIFDAESSKLSEKLIFYSDSYILTHEDLKKLEKSKLLNWVSLEFLPNNITCQAIVQIENFNKVIISFFNIQLKLSEEIYEEPMDNKNLIEWYKAKWYFYIEFKTNLSDSWINISFNYDN
jgi:hypothetical protein